MPSTPPTPIPNPLGQSAEGFAASAVARRDPGGFREALDRYARLFRAGEWSSAGPVAAGFLAPIKRVHLSESPEGAVVKFTQVVGVADGAPASSLAASLPVLASPGQDLEIESVLIPMVGKKRLRSYTLCVSSQVGCAMGCSFCQTAQMGLIRSLSPAQIVGQWFAAQHLLQRPDPDAQIRNIVFMGMGEPMDNLPNVIAAIDVLTDRRGPNIAMSRITVSTVGRLDGIRSLGQHIRRPGWHRLGLAISLNAPNDQIRSAIMPINRAMPLAALRRELLDWPIFGGSHQCLEYVLIPGVNDADDHAQQLAAFVLGDAYPGPATPRYDGRPITGLVNVIPYNPRDHSPWPAPSEETVERFMATLAAAGVYVKRRRTKGRDTMAACGQLGNPQLARARSRN